MTTSSNSISLIRIAHAMLAAGVVLVLTVVMAWIGPGFLGQGVIALLYLVPCGWATFRWGQAAGVGAALAAALCFDFFFIPPYNTFTIGSPEGWLLLFLFVAASILVVGRFQTMFRQEQTLERKAMFLYETVASIANQQTREGVAGAVAKQLQQMYLADLVQVHLNSRGKLPALAARATNGHQAEADKKPERALPLISETALIGEIDIWKGLVPLPSVDDFMVQAMLRQTAAALDRVQVIEEKLS